MGSGRPTGMTDKKDGWRRERERELGKSVRSARRDDDDALYQGFLRHFENSLT